MIEQIDDNGLIIAIIIKAGFKKDGVEFFTPDNFSQQLGYMKRPKGYKIAAHTHKKNFTDIVITHEVLYVKSGRIKVSLYNNNKMFLQERQLTSGDVILLATGGHAVEMIEASELIEIKQGPYCDKDKVIFTPANRNDER